MYSIHCLFLSDESTDNMVTTLDDSAVSDSLIDPDEAEPLSSSRPKDDPKRIYQPKSQTPQENGRFDVKTLALVSNCFDQGRCIDTHFKPCKHMNFAQLFCY